MQLISQHDSAGPSTRAVIFVLLRCIKTIKIAFQTVYLGAGFFTL